LKTKEIAADQSRPWRYRGLLSSTLATYREIIGLPSGLQTGQHSLP
jgi:hypothetical protein